MDAKQAVDDLMDVSSQIESAVVYDKGGNVVASTLAEAEAGKRFAEAAETLFSAAADTKNTGAVTHLEAATADGSVFVVRKGDRTIAAATAAEPTVALVFYDLRTCLENVAEEPKPKPRKRAAPRKPKKAAEDGGAA